MNDNDYKKIADLVDERVNKTLDPIKTDLTELKQDLKDVKKTQEDHTNRLEALSGDVEQVLDEVKAINDKGGMFHSRNKREIDEIKRHFDMPIMPDIPEI